MPFSKKVLSLIIAFAMIFILVVPVFAADTGDNDVNFDDIGKNEPDYGDVTGDGTIDLFDLIRLAKRITDSSTECVEDNADVTGNGTIDVLDLIRLAKYITDDSVELGPQ